MRIRAIGVLGCAVAAFFLTGCTMYIVGAPAGPGKAYVIKHDTGASRQTMLLCDATGGTPVCAEQREQ